MEYKLQNIALDLEKDKLEFPHLKDRVIEKRGHLITFTMNEIERNDEILKRNRKEVEAKMEYEKAVMHNVESYHPFVLDMTPEDLLTAWMYQEAKGNVKMCADKLEEIDKQLTEDEAEIAEIKKQIPEFEELTPKKKKNGKKK